MAKVDRSPRLEFAGDFKGFKHRIFRYTSQSTGAIQTGVRGLQHAAWEPDASGDAAAVTITDAATGEVTLTAAAAENGNLHLWSES